MVIDSREKQPFHFDQIMVRKRGKRIPLCLTAVVDTLKTGDYAIQGLEDKCCVERKSVKDLVSTIAGRRKRFIKELERMQEMEFSAVVVEGNWGDVQRYCDSETNYHPASLDGSILAFNQRYKGTHWYFRPTKATAAKTTYKILDRFWRDKNG